jgi:hypothetical protein
MSRSAAEMLPADLLARATLRGNEYAWPVDDIPQVIEAAQKANLVSIGGQLQFRLSDATYECYWVQVDTYQSVQKKLAWRERVERTAEAGASDFAELCSNLDFLAAGREGFAEHLDALSTEGRDPSASMCFVWYLLTEDEAKARDA